MSEEKSDFREVWAWHGQHRRRKQQVICMCVKNIYVAMADRRPSARAMIVESLDIELHIFRSLGITREEIIFFVISLLCCGGGHLCQLRACRVESTRLTGRKKKWLRSDWLQLIRLLQIRCPINNDAFKINYFFSPLKHPSMLIFIWSDQYIWWI